MKHTLANAGKENATHGEGSTGGWGVENKTHLYYYPRRYNILLEHTPEYIYKIGRSKRSFSYSVVQSCPPAFDVV